MPDPPVADNPSQPQGSKSKKNRKKKAKQNKAQENNIEKQGVVQELGNDAETEVDVDGLDAKEEAKANGTTKPAEDNSDGSEAEPEQEVLKNVASTTNGSDPLTPTNTDDANERFAALVQDRDNLRAEVTELRKSLEDLQQKHQTDIDALKEQLEETQGEKDHAESQYRNLLGKVNTIKSQLGERLKADAEDLAHARTRIAELEERNSSLEQEVSTRTEEITNLDNEIQAQSKELSTLRNHTNLSQQNWVKEKEELEEQAAYLREEFENAKQAMHDWEVLAMEERSIRRGFEDKSADLEEQVSHLKGAFEKASSERDTQSLAVDGLQKALQEIQGARKQELRELVEASQKEEESLRKQLEEAEKAATEAKEELETVKADLERALPFEKEVKEKNLLIGKLRHEAVILNDHLTKALRFLKKGKPEDNVDRQIVTNHFLHFLALDRSDPKKFQVLQLIAALLNWNEEQREQAGLARPGTSAFNSGSLRIPSSPFHRTPSTPALHAEYFTDSSPATKETLSDLWQNFLEQEAQQGQSKSRRSSSITVPKVRSPPASSINTATPKSPEEQQLPDSQPSS